MNGIVKKVISDRGFGFIEPDDNGSDVFFHVSSLVDLEFDAALVARRVTYDVEQSHRGPRAINVRGAA